MNLNETEWKRLLRFDEIPKERQDYYTVSYGKLTKSLLFVKIGDWREAYCLRDFDKSHYAEDILIYWDYDELIIIQVSPCGTMYRLIEGI